MDNVKANMFSETVEDSMEEILKDSSNAQDDGDSMFLKVAQDSMDLEMIEHSMDAQDDGNSLFSKVVPGSMDLEMIEDSIDAQDDGDSLLSKVVPGSIDSEDHQDSFDITSSVEKKPLLDIDLNLPADLGFDLNKFPEEEDEESDEVKKTMREILKISLPKFY